MNVRGTQQGSSLRIPAPAPIASWLPARLAIVFVVMDAPRLRFPKAILYHRPGVRTRAFWRRSDVALCKTKDQAWSDDARVPVLWPARDRHREPRAAGDCASGGWPRGRNSRQSHGRQPAVDAALEFL